MRQTAIACCVLLVALFSAAGCGGEKERTVPEALAWLDFDDGLALAEREEKPVLVDFYTSWCVWCKRMDERTFSDPDVKAYLAEHFVTVRMNAEARGVTHRFEGRSYTPVELTRRFGVRGFPSLAYLSKKGEIVTVVPGFQTPGQLMPMLEYVAKECYEQRMTFEEFLKRREECD